MTTFPISEIFGPTIQGEGAMIGRQTLFVRFVGCDYKCAWCDTKYAAFPDHIKEERAAGRVSNMSKNEIVLACLKLTDQARHWITFSGGNPALFDTLQLIARLQASGYRVAMETQGSKMPYPTAIRALDHLILSPKPPSSEMTTDLGALREISAAVPIQRRSIKIVVFDELDLEYAVMIREQFPDDDQFFLSAGTPQDESLLRSSVELENVILRRTAWVADQLKTKYYDSLHGVGVLPQLHVLLWGAERGV